MYFMIIGFLKHVVTFVGKKNEVDLSQVWLRMPLKDV